MTGHLSSPNRDGLRRLSETHATTNENNRKAKFAALADSPKNDEVSELSQRLSIGNGDCINRTGCFLSRPLPGPSLTDVPSLRPPFGDSSIGATC